MRRRCGAPVAFVVLLAATLQACASVSAPRPGLADAVAISYRTIPLSENAPLQRRVGRLIYRGGLELSSPDPRFGGWSGLIVSADGKRMLSQSDEAHWLRADLVYDRHGDLVGIRNAQLADMLDMDGKTMRKHEGDAEGLDALTPAGPDGAVAVSFERDARVWRYDLSRSLDVRPTLVPMPAGIKVADNNLGLEGLTRFAPDALLAVTEDTHESDGDMYAWLVPYPRRAPDIAYGRLGVRPHAPYQISDAAMGPSGKYLYLLERHYFGPIGGIVIAVRRIDAATVRAGARLGGTEIAKFSMRENIDNMEGLALRRGASGHTYLYMISDDNYDHTLQRTLLLMFELDGKGP